MRNKSIIHVSQNVFSNINPAMNWFIIALVFHVLRLNLCVALSPVCTDQQYLSAGECVNCTVCKEPGKNATLRPCSTTTDTICGSVSDIHIDLPGIKIKPKYKNDINNRYLTINSETNLSKENITDILKKLSESEKSTPTAKDTLDTNYNNYYDDDTDEDDDLDYTDSTDGIYTAVLKRPQANQQPVKKSNKKTFSSSSEASKVQPKKDSNVSNSKYNKPTKNSILSDVLNNEENITVVDPDTLLKKAKHSRKLKSKETSVEINDHTLKIADTQFKVGNEKTDDGRWLELSHPHIVNKKIFVDLMEKDKKGSTFFSSGEKQTDQEYANEMAKLLNETSSVLDGNHTTASNQTNVNTEDYDNNVLKNLDDEDEDDDDDDDEDDDDDDEDEEDEDGVNDDDEPLIYNDFGSANSSDRTDSVETQDYDSDDDTIDEDVLNGFEKTDGGERPDFDKDDDGDLQENDLYEDRTYMQPDLSGNDILAEPFVSTANWQILILVAAMSACLLFFIVVSAYICIYMRRRRHFKSTFVADVEDLSSRVNLIQHVRFEGGDDSSNTKNFISQLKSGKSNNEKLPKIYARSE